MICQEIPARIAVVHPRVPEKTRKESKDLFILVARKGETVFHLAIETVKSFMMIWTSIWNPSTETLQKKTSYDDLLARLVASWPRLFIFPFFFPPFESR